MLSNKIIEGQTHFAVFKKFYKKESKSIIFHDDSKYFLKEAT